MHSVEILPNFVQTITSFTVMRMSNTIRLGLFFMGLFIAYACGGKSSETEGDAQSMIELGDDSQKTSPLRTAAGRIGTADVKVQYGSPAVRNRIIWGDLLPYGEVWRTGANEATFVEFSEDVTVEGQELKAGKYSLFTIPRESGKWTVIFNSEWNLQHGHYQYKEENDVLRVEAMPQWGDTSQENLSISVEDNGLLLKWEKLSLPISIQ
jgi:hypothetical protein